MLPGVAVLTVMGCVARCYSCNCDVFVLMGVAVVTVVWLCCQVLQL